MQAMHKHTLMDAPFHNGTFQNLNVFQHVGSTLGRFIFTEHQPAFHARCGESVKLENCTINFPPGYAAVAMPLQKGCPSPKCAILIDPDPALADESRLQKVARWLGCAVRWLNRPVWCKEPK